MIHYQKLVGSALFIISVFALSGCGQKGDLYLPNIPPAPDVLASDKTRGPGVSGQEASVPLVSGDSIIENEKNKQKESSLHERPMTSETE